MPVALGPRLTVTNTATTLPDEQLLVDRARRGDVAAFETLVRGHHRRMYAVAFRIVRNATDAEDATQDAFVRAWRALPNYRGDAKFSTWLYRITTNVALNKVTRRREHASDEIPERVSTAADPARRVTDAERLDIVLAALDTLTPEQRATYLLRDVEGLAYEDIAEALGISLSAVKSRLFRARQDLAQALAAYDLDDDHATPTPSAPSDERPRRRRRKEVTR